jgi:hypothetical protein
MADGDGSFGRRLVRLAKTGVLIPRTSFLFSTAAAAGALLSPMPSVMKNKSTAAALASFTATRTGVTQSLPCNLQKKNYVDFVECRRPRSIKLCSTINLFTSHKDFDYEHDTHSILKL